MAASRGPVSTRELARLTGLGEKRTTQAVRQLARKKQAQRVGRGWLGLSTPEGFEEQARKLRQCTKRLDRHQLDTAVCNILHHDEFAYRLVDIALRLDTRTAI